MTGIESANLYRSRGEQLLSQSHLSSLGIRHSRLAWDYRISSGSWLSHWLTPSEGHLTFGGRRWKNSAAVRRRRRWKIFANMPNCSFERPSWSRGSYQIFGEYWTWNKKLLTSLLIRMANEIDNCRVFAWSVWITQNQILKLFVFSFVWHLFQSSTSSLLLCLARLSFSKRIDLPSDVLNSTCLIAKIDLNIR
jgi:hypothetical protein